MFDADRPIVSHTQDRLGRAIFAKYLARCMLDHQSPESLVIGLYGRSGTGKTSLINLALEEIRFAASNMPDDEKPVILNFSPWSYSGQGQLIYGFFRRLSSELRQCADLEQGAEIINLLELYVSFFTHQPVPKLLRSKSKLLSTFKKNLFKRPSPEKKATVAWESGRDPTQVKAQLNELLRKQKRKLIIFIDNISRLESGEINQILQIVKSMGDYTNTIYMLALDKEQVVQAIDQVHAGEGKEYLDKLVQLPFAVPPISKQDVESLLFDRLQPVTELAPEEAWDISLWADMYYASLKYFFNSCRDITRYVNTLSFSFAFVKDVVNPVDFFALTAIEVFAPRVLYGIRENKDLFTDLLDNVYVLDTAQREEDKARCDEILGRESHIPREIMQQLIFQLFPRIRSVYHPDEKFYHSPTLAREKLRVSSPDTFDIYFRLSIPTGFMPEAELETLLKQANHADSFDQIVSRLNQDGRILRFLDLLDSTASVAISEQNIGHVISGLMDSGDLFPESPVSRMRFQTAMRIHRICQQLLLRLPSQSERFDIMKTAIDKATKSIYIIVHELTVLGEEHRKQDEMLTPAEHRILTATELQTLRLLTCEKIEFWARIGRLIEHPKLLPVLTAWKNWGSDDACQGFIERSVREEKGLLAFLSATLQVPIDHVVNHQQKGADWREYLETITYFIPTEPLAGPAITLFESDHFEQLREKEQLAILIFLDLINAKTTKVIPKTGV
jgi:predicted KAP-like P-loop ATPase